MNFQVFLRNVLIENGVYLMRSEQLMWHNLYTNKTRI